MSRRFVGDTKEATVDVDTVPEVQGGWRKPNSGEVGIHARGICGIHRKTFVMILDFTISRGFSPKNTKKFTTKLQMLDVIVHISPESTSRTGIVIVCR